MIIRTAFEKNILFVPVSAQTKHDVSYFNFVHNIEIQNYRSHTSWIILLQFGEYQQYQPDIAAWTRKVPKD